METNDQGPTSASEKNVGYLGFRLHIIGLLVSSIIYFIAIW